MLTQLSPLSLEFPHPSRALSDPNGLLAFGGDLSLPRLVRAYEHGIFPWYGEGEPIMWWSPHPRTVFYPSEIHVSKSLRKFLKKTDFRFSINQDFESVIQGCADTHELNTGTWITEAMENAYHELHLAGHAHSIEVWQNDELVGGLYGVLVGSTFCGESMFHTATNASKCALLALCSHLSPQGLELIDCQVPNPHLYSLGANDLPREDYLEALHAGLEKKVAMKYIQPQFISISELAFSSETR